MKDINIMDGNSKYIISDEELENVSGGKFSSESLAWMDRNGTAITDRYAAKHGRTGSGAFALIMMFSEMNGCENTLSIDDVKAYYKKKGIDVDDLT